MVLVRARARQSFADLLRDKVPQASLCQPAETVGRVVGQKITLVAFGISKQLIPLFPDSLRHVRIPNVRD